MYGCGEQEVGVASGSGWNLWVWLLGVVVRRYIDFLILLIPTSLESVLFCSSIPTFFVHYNTGCLHDRQENPVCLSLCSTHYKLFTIESFDILR